MGDLNKVRELLPLIDDAQDAVFNVHRLIESIGKFEIVNPKAKERTEFNKIKELMTLLQISAKAANNAFKDNGTVKPGKPNAIQDDKVER